MKKKRGLSHNLAGNISFLRAKTYFWPNHVWPKVNVWQTKTINQSIIVHVGGKPKRTSSFDFFFLFRAGLFLFSFSVELTILCCKEDSWIREPVEESREALLEEEELVLPRIWRRKLSPLLLPHGLEKGALPLPIILVLQVLVRNQRISRLVTWDITLH
jgi:hypothetical protein